MAREAELCVEGHRGRRWADMVQEEGEVMAGNPSHPIPDLLVKVQVTPFNFTQVDFLASKIPLQDAVLACQCHCITAWEFALDLAA